MRLQLLTYITAAKETLLHIPSLLITNLLTLHQGWSYYVICITLKYYYKCLNEEILSIHRKHRFDSNLKERIDRFKCLHFHIYDLARSSEKIFNSVSMVLVVSFFINCVFDFYLAFVYLKDLNINCNKIIFFYQNFTWSSVFFVAFILVTSSCESVYSEVIITACYPFHFTFIM